MPKPIHELCVDPYAMRRRADRGLQVPCYRCLGSRPGEGSGCFFVNRKTKPIKSKTPEPHEDPPRLL